MGTRIGFSYFIILCLFYKILSYRFLTFMCLFTLASCDFQLGIGGIGVDIRELTIHYVKQCDDLMSGSHMVDHVVEVHGLRSSTAYVTTRIRKNQFSYNHCIRSALLNYQSLKIRQITHQIASHYLLTTQNWHFFQTKGLLYCREIQLRVEDKVQIQNASLKCL